MTYVTPAGPLQLCFEVVIFCLNWVLFSSFCMILLYLVSLFFWHTKSVLLLSIVIKSSLNLNHLSPGWTLLFFSLMVHAMLECMSTFPFAQEILVLQFLAFAYVFFLHTKSAHYWSIVIKETSLSLNRQSSRCTLLIFFLARCMQWGDDEWLYIPLCGRSLSNNFSLCCCLYLSLVFVFPFSI